jgi:hypothetical protein
LQPPALIPRSYAPASVFQMLRGSIVVFTFFLSMVILKQKKQP